MKKLLVVLVILAVVAAGVAYFLSDRGSYGGGSSGPVAFTTVEPYFGNLYDVVGGTGYVQPQETLVISTELNGKVVKILKDFNDVVESGDELIQLDDRMVRGKMDQVEKEMQSAAKAIQVAETDLEKATSLRNAAQTAYNDLMKLAIGVVSKPQQDEAKFRLDAASAAVHLAERSIEVAKSRQAVAESGLKLAQLPVEMSTIRVPFVSRPDGDKSRPGIRDVGSVVADGSEAKRKYIVLDRKIVLNQMVGPPNATHLFTLVTDLDTVDLQVQVNESDIGKIHPGDKVNFTVSAYQDDDQVFTGEVVETRLLPTVLQGSVSYTVLITAKNVEQARTEKDGKNSAVRWMLRPGMSTAGVDIITSTKKDVWAIPNTALDFQLDEGYYTPAAREILAKQKGTGWVAVWVQDGDEAKPVWVKPTLMGKIDNPHHTGLRSEPFTLVEWDPDMRPQPKAGEPSTYPKLIIGAPPPRKAKFLPNLPSVVKF